MGKKYVSPALCYAPETLSNFYKMAFEKKVRKNSVENSFQAQNKTAKFLASKAKHARHITYKSIIQLASQKKFWHKHGMKKKTFAFSRTK